MSHCNKISPQDEKKRQIYVRLRMNVLILETRKEDAPEHRRSDSETEKETLCVCDATNRQQATHLDTMHFIGSMVLGINPLKSMQKAISAFVY